MMSAGTIVPTRMAPDAAELALPGRAKAWAAAQDFEAMSLGQFLAPIFETVKQSGGPFGGGNAEDSWTPMLTQELAKRMAKAGGLGLAVPIYRQMLLMQEAAQSNTRGADQIETAVIPPRSAPSSPPEPAA